MRIELSDGAPSVDELSVSGAGDPDGLAEQSGRVSAAAATNLTHRLPFGVGLDVAYSLNHSPAE